jgi:predicted enzyme related to lactoylglutathione lyase
MVTMPGRGNGAGANVAHFAINADDLDRARRFYAGVFGWRFEAWGPPGFFMIETGTGQEPAIRGSLQKRRELIAGERMTGYECTISVADVDAVAAAVVAHGGKIIMPRTFLPTVGHLIFFRDQEGNVAGAMQYDPDAEDEP